MSNTSDEVKDATLARHRVALAEYEADLAKAGVAVLAERQALAPATARYSRQTPGGAVLEIEVPNWDGGPCIYYIDGIRVSREDFKTFDRFGPQTAGPNTAQKVSE